eukprot:15103541-Heterocapsa_arctica.AAC.1
MKDQYNDHGTEFSHLTSVRRLASGPICAKRAGLTGLTLPIGKGDADGYSHPGGRLRPAA